ncbi:MAG: FAD-binding oxidoreductase [Dehalococcoidia bacterium]|nr:MAG: FAD-binding oxidoreductase [Dehalococcoidia bacterium]
MSLSREAYKALEDIVGPENISEEPAILDGYCFIWANEVHFGDKFSARPPAVVMPGSTEEVQGVVKVCNRYNIKYRAHASGFEVPAISAREPFLPVDLRRMNRIVEIDRNNRFAVVEPYVSVQFLLTETIKQGLRPASIGCGPSASIIASSTSHFGCGTSNVSTDYAGRTPLGVEWVLPDANILRVGTPGTGAGWFSGDGPGPSLRGIMRGLSGPNGGMGIVTRAAVKLTPWYGPTSNKAKGKPNLYEYDIPEDFIVQQMVFQSREHMNDFFIAMVEESIAHGIQRSTVSFLGMLAAESNDEFWNMIKDSPPEMEELYKFSGSFLVDSSSPRELKYRQQLADKLLDKYEVMTFPLEEQMKSALFYSLMTGQGSQRLFRVAGSFLSASAAQEAWDAMGNTTRLCAEDIWAKYEMAGKITAGGEAPWGTALGDWSSHVESVVVYDPLVPESVQAVRDILAEVDEKLPKWSLGMGSFEGCLSPSETAQKKAAPYCLDFMTYEKKLKKLFDPNLVSESTWYVTPDK